MPYVETLEEIVESFADSFGIDNHKLTLVDPTDEGSSHADDCGCRKCWSGRLEQRIRTAVHCEAIYNRVKVQMAQSSEVRRHRVGEMAPCPHR